MEIAISMRKIRGKLNDLPKEFKKGGYLTKILVIWLRNEKSI